MCIVSSAENITCALCRKINVAMYLQNIHNTIFIGKLRKNMKSHSVLY